MSGKMALAVVFVFLINLYFVSLSSAVVINEFTADPQSDWEGGGSITQSDEWFELYNPDNITIDLTGWTLHLLDGTDIIENLSGNISAGGYFVILNPKGDQKDSGQIRLYNFSEDLVDLVTYGSYNDSNISDNAPSGGANSMQDECLSRMPNGVDTDVDSADFVKSFCTYNSENGILPKGQQGLNATIMGRIVLQILPRWLEFGSVYPGTINNHALNGPIVFDATGSGADVNVEITDVFGSLFEEGLKIDNRPAVGSSWLILFTNPIQEAVPTLDVSEDAQSGNVQGIIVYTVSGPTP